MNKFMEGQKKIEGAVVSGYQKIEDAFVKSFLTPDESPDRQSGNVQSSESKGD